MDPVYASTFIFDAFYVRASMRKGQIGGAPQTNSHIVAPVNSGIFVIACGSTRSSTSQQETGMVPAKC